MRHGVITGLVVAVLAGPGFAAIGQAETPRRPNILWLIAEDICPDLGCYGDPDARTPNLDGLAREGRMYCQAFSTAPVCSASRSAFCTGMYQNSFDAQHHRSHRDDGFRLPAGVRLITDRLRDEGYFTANVVTLPPEAGFRGTGKTDWNFGYDGKPFDSNRWEDLKSHQPFYAHLNFSQSHRVYEKAKRDPTDPAKVTLPPYLPNHPVAREDWAVYHDSIRTLDENVGAVLKLLEKDGLRENTIVFFFADHGRDCFRGKYYAYEQGFHVPLLIRWPSRLAAASTSNALVSLVDLPATVLALAGCAVPKEMHGRPLLGAAAEKREYIFASRDRIDNTFDRVRTVRDARYKYIYNFRPELPYLQWMPYADLTNPVNELMRKLTSEGRLSADQAKFMAPSRPREELYDLKSDPFELHNLALSPAAYDVLVRMRRQLDGWIRLTKDHGLIPEDPRQERKIVGDYYQKHLWGNLRKPGGVLPCFLETPAIPAAAAQTPRNVRTVTSTVAEIAFQSARNYRDPFRDVTLDIVFTEPSGRTLVVPAFWAGAGAWKVRYSSPVVGVHRFRTTCSAADDPGLHNVTGSVTVEPYAGANSLYRHGPIRVADDHRHFAHADGTQFFWLGDTWWCGLAQRNGFGFEQFQSLTRDRQAKGFTVIQIVAGLYPDMPPRDPRGFNEAGHPWESDFARINPAYFDMADRRIGCLADQGLVPCVVGAWGYHVNWLGIAGMKQHWRNLVARWGAYPVVWCLAGEGTMPYYLSIDKPDDVAFQKHAWSEIARYVREIDPWHRPITIHPTHSARETLDDPSLLDFDMLQTGHAEAAAITNTVQTVCHQVAQTPAMPVIDGEVTYEGHMQANGPGIQRFMFWTCVLNGAAGHTYGVGGLWQLNTRQQPFGPSPHGGTYENRPWDEASQLPGSGQLGLGKSLLARYPWWRFEPHPDWAEPRWSPKDYMAPYAAGIPGQFRIIYIPQRFYRWTGPNIQDLEEGLKYRAFYFDPITGHETDLGVLAGDAKHRWAAPPAPLAQDWVLVLERVH